MMCIYICKESNNLMSQIHYERTTFREQFQCLFILFFFLWNAEFCRWASNWISRRVELWILPWSCAQSRRRQLRNGCSSSLNLRLFFPFLLLLLVFVRWHVIYTELRFPITSHHFLLLLLLSRLYITLYMKIRLWFVASQVFWSFFFKEISSANLILAVFFSLFLFFEH